MRGLRPLVFAVTFAPFPLLFFVISTSIVCGNWKNEFMGCQLPIFDV